MKVLAKVVAVLVVAVPFIVGPQSNAAADRFQEALRAFDEGKYAMAMRLWRPLAERGDADALFGIAMMYDNGYGLARDYAAAAKWYRRAAERGSVMAQHNLGLMHFNGEGVAQDYVRAHMWLDIASVNGDRSSRTGKKIVAEQMTGVQIAEAKTLARMWLAQHGRKQLAQNMKNPS
ncbi:MAG: tetratricopeptide repeat protein [Alphaproteobacteria bacterium]|jgi:hypothetical protein|nr:tetratricopeptide repeat protein [Alphaproteobacteria bacterium]